MEAYQVESQVPEIEIFGGTQTLHSIHTQIIKPVPEKILNK